MKEIKENDNTFEDVIEFEETGEVLEENNDEQITEKAENEEFANKKKSEDEIEKAVNSADEVFSVAANNSLGKTSDDKCEHIELETKEEGFIGPRLPRVMTNEEFKTLMDKLLGYKYY